ncbi:MAG: hypothetical protein CL676_03590 [Bdellovibrionaceae bacterium]|nr:hypothetical protein [Pseudobdellovibrionaceae bacterium]|tara:strand:+ start:3333 stop:3683 length:351 start_codon:yes stop_codon:yes gene_type:complete
MSDFLSEQRKDIRILNSVKNLIEEGKLSSVNNLIEKRADSVLRSTVENLFQSAVREYVHDNTGGNLSYHGISSVNDILEPQEFGQNYWGRKIQEEIDRKKSLLVEFECRHVSTICG